MPNRNDIEYPTVIQKRIVWTGLSAFFAVLIGAIAVGLVLLFGWVLGYLQPILVPVAVAAIFAYLLEPIINWLRKKQRWPRLKSVYVVYASTVFLALLLAFLVIYPAFREGRQFLAEYLSPLPESELPAHLVASGSSDEDERPWLARTKLGTNGIKALDYFDQKLGGLPFVKQFKDTSALDGELKWDLSAIGQVLWTKLSGFVDEVIVFFSRGVSSAASIFGYILGLFLVPIYLFFFLRESSSISRTWTDYIPLRESKLKDEVVDTLHEINGYLIAYFRGQMVVSIIDAVLVTIALSLIGLPYALLIGAFLAILGLIPYIGSLLVMIPTVIISMVHFGHKVAKPIADIDPARFAGEIATMPGAAEMAYEFDRTWGWLPNQIWAYPLIVIGFFVILQQINGFVTAPKIVGDSVGLHPLTVIFSMLFWGLLLGGMLGALIAVPLTASVKVLFRRYIWMRKIQPSIKRKPAPA